MMNLDKNILLIAALLFAQPLYAAELQGVLGWSGIATMGFAVPGTVDSVEVQPGARVSKGQLLVRLEQRPFLLEAQKYRAATETIEPLLFDAKVELTQAEELYDRTVLSQIELQKVDARYRGLQAQSRVAQKDYELAKWRQEKSSLQAPFDAVVIESHFTQGQVITEENRGDLALLLVPADIMGVNIVATAEELSRLAIGQQVQVIIGSEQLAGKVQQLHMAANDKGQYRCVIEFKYPAGKTYYAGQTVKVSY